jgi:hypothetical protein
MLVGIADNLGDAGQGREFLGGALGVASCDHDLCSGVFAVDAADRSPGVVVGGGSDGAGIEDHDSRVGDGVSALEASFLELAFDSSSVGLCGTTAEVLDIKTGHESILTARNLGRRGQTTNMRRCGIGHARYSAQCCRFVSLLAQMKRNST